MAATIGGPSTFGGSYCTPCPTDTTDSQLEEQGGDRFRLSNCEVSDLSEHCTKEEPTDGCALPSDDASAGTNMCPSSQPHEEENIGTVSAVSNSERPQARTCVANDSTNAQANCTAPPAQQRRRGPVSEEERLRVREKYKERLQERKLQIYESALQAVIDREQAQSFRCVTFRVAFNTRFGQELFLIGSAAVAGNWKPESAIPLSWSEGNVWGCDLHVPADLRRLEYKYIVKEGCNVFWEPGDNHVLNLHKYTVKPKDSAEEPRGVHVVDIWGSASGSG